MVGQLTMQVLGLFRREQIRSSRRLVECRGVRFNELDQNRVRVLSAPDAETQKLASHYRFSDARVGVGSQASLLMRRY